MTGDSHEIVDGEPIPEDAAAAARLVVCGYALDAAEASALFRMLGIEPDFQHTPLTHCGRCDKPMSRTHILGWVRSGSGGFCRRCANERVL